MMIKHIWSVLCKESLIDQETNNISLHSVLEQLTVSLGGEVKTIPPAINVPINYEIVSLWIRDEDLKEIQVKVQYTVRDPKGSNLFKEIKDMAFPKSIRRMRSRLRFNKIVVNQAGKYTFEVAIKENTQKDFRTVCEVPLEVIVQRKPGGDKRGR